MPEAVVGVRTRFISTSGKLRTALFSCAVLFVGLIGGAVAVLDNGFVDWIISKAILSSDIDESLSYGSLSNNKLL